MMRTNALMRSLVRSGAALLVAWVAMARAGEAGCKANSYCEWHVFSNDVCKATTSGMPASHCTINDSTQECWTVEGPDCTPGGS